MFHQGNLIRGNLIRAFAMLVVLAGSTWPALLHAQVPALTVSQSDRDEEYDVLIKEAEALQRFNEQIKRVARFVRPSVVHIEAHKIEGRRTIDEAGSGAILSFDDGYFVLTNRHVIKDAAVAQIKVKLDDGRVLRPSQVWSDVGTDVAVMQLDATGLIPARVGNSDAVEVGDFVMAVGSPFGLSHSITLGIISATGRRDLKLGVDGVLYQNFFQTDAAINPGNSGGPLVNLRGEVVGLNTAIASNSGGNDGIGFSIPINIAVDIARQLAESGRVVRAFLGVVLDAEFSTQDAIRLGLPRQMGARIKDITANSAAAESNLKVGDVILEFDRVRIDDDKHLVNQVKLTPVGKEVAVFVLRGGSPVTIRTVVGRRQEE